MTNEQLEQFIDQNSVGCLLDKIGRICHEKSEHIRINWQDVKLAECWDNVATVLDKAVKDIGVRI